MRISELIEILSKIKQEQGNLSIFIDRDDHLDLEDVNIVEDDGGKYVLLT